MKPFYFIILLLCTGACHNGDRQKELVTLPVSDVAVGDIVFRKGLGVKSQAITYTDSLSVYSHVGIVVKNDSNFFVVHITPDEREKGATVDRIKMELLRDFFMPSKTRHGMFMRFSDSTEIAAVAAKHAVRLYQKGILFDHDYNLYDTVAMYCTEMVWYAYLLAGRDVTQGRRHVLQGIPRFSGEYIFPSDIHKNSKLYVYFKF
ncbi:MAG: hypothetical protein LBS16_00425 [Prevotellaceae bacterium]|nr:hypothetical protein [Prevotellaceae bacterium]